MQAKIFLVPFLLVTSSFFAQSGTMSSGGTATGSNGHVSYSVGQVFYQTISGTGGSVSHGVQQPFEITTLGTDEVPQIVLNARVYPNPTTAQVFLEVSNYPLEQLSYSLFDLQGRRLTFSTISQESSQISMESLPASTYFLQIHKENTLIKTFKISKK
ncbi:T9SS type A sorting domain-containing protein [Flavobacterium sp.]|uniref:T9SS type A sorting domain-containing protein n=1 Tax=Flavobacterium sp. TaxID=239 RepID=UPI003D0CEA9A